ncbi:MAG: hypothetical protein JEZ02_04075 [Desulfatibacillum sp.]|nr:hypothetical protein [Desulfatibacillum sp.]
MAVAIKDLGFSNIRIYNGGLKDWAKAGYEIESQEPLPEYEGSYMEAQELLALIRRTDIEDCKDKQGNPLFTILDYRTELVHNEGKDLPVISTKCPQLVMLLDDFADPVKRDTIPRTGTVILVSETGNRDPFAMRYLHNHGYDNIVGLRFGMRAWIKAGYPVEMSR